MKHKDWVKEKIDRINTLTRSTQQLIKRGGNANQVNEFLEKILEELQQLDSRVDLED